MKAPSRESIERILGPQPPLPVPVKPKDRTTWNRMTPEEKTKILKFAAKNPSYSYKEMSERFGRAPGVIHKLCKTEGVR